MKNKRLTKNVMAICIGILFAVPALAQQQKPCNPNGIDSLETLKQYSLYREDFRAKRYDVSYPSWVYIFTNAPCFREQALADGPEFMEYFLKNTKDATRRRQLLDTLDLIYKTRLIHFNNESLVKGKWGKAILELDPANQDKGINLLAEAVAKGGKATDAVIMKPYLEAKIAKYKKKEISKDSLLAIYENLSVHIDYNLKNDAGSEALYGTGLSIENVSENTFVTQNAVLFETGDKIAFKGSYSAPVYVVTYVEDSIVTVSENIEETSGSKIFQYKKLWKATQDNINALGGPFLKCDDIERIYGPKFEADKKNNELEETIMLYLSNARCTNSDFYIKVAIRHLEMNPHTDGYRLLAEAYRKKGMSAKAVENYEKAAKLETDDTKKARDYINIAKSYLAARNCQQARSAALQVLSINPSSGEAYILIGDSYALCASACGDAFEVKTVYWAAVDQYAKAKAADKGVAGAANSRINTYSNYFPEKKDVFFRNLTDGSSYTLKCWPNVTTTIRSK